MTSSIKYPEYTSRNAQFLLHGTASAGSSTDCITVGSTAEEHLSGIDIRVGLVPTSHANESGLRDTVLAVDNPTHGARLGTVGGRYLYELTTPFLKFVTKHMGKITPASVENGPVEAGLGANIRAWIFYRALRRCCHVRNLQLFDNHHAVIIGVVKRFVMQKVLTLPTSLAMQTGYMSLCLLAIFGSFLLSSNVALCAFQPALNRLEVLGVWDDSPIRVGDGVGDALVDSNSRLFGRRGVVNFDFADDGGKPLIAVSFDGASFGFTAQRAMKNDWKPAKFGETEVIFFDSPHLRVRFTYSENRLIFFLPPRLMSQAFETTLPSFVKLPEELHTGISGNIGEPRYIDTQIRELVTLIESSQIYPSRTRTCQTHQPLLMGKIPKKSQSILPSQEPSLLFWRGINAVAEASMQQHVYRPIGCSFDCVYRQSSHEQLETSNSGVFLSLALPISKGPGRAGFGQGFFSSWAYSSPIMDPCQGGK